MKYLLQDSDILNFLEWIPSSAQIDLVKDRDFIRHFENPRMKLILEQIGQVYQDSDEALGFLDFGYLHGIIPYVLHTHYPQAKITCIDHPGSHVFKNPESARIVSKVPCLSLAASDISDDFTKATSKSYDVVTLGEVIEHMNPSDVVAVLERVFQVLKNNGLLVITTPNARGAFNVISTMFGKDVIYSPTSYN